MRTVAIPDPGWAFESGLLSDVSSADEQERGQLRDALDELMGDLYVEFEATQVATGHLVELAVPEGLVGQNVAADGQATLVDRIRDAILEVPYEFKLDGLLALEDLLDSLDEDDEEE